MKPVVPGTTEEARFQRVWVTERRQTERRQTERRQTECRPTECRPTECRPTEAALRESEDRYHTLFDLCPVAVYSCDASGVIEKFNRRAVELWGREPELGDTDERFCGSFKFFRPDGSFMPHEQCPMAEVVSGKLGQVCDGEVLIERPEGSRVTVIVNIRPLKNEHGEVAGAINCFYDITERKRPRSNCESTSSNWPTPIAARASS
jgi:PAS domain-containing protein